MNGTEFMPVESGPGVPVPQLRGEAPKNEERRQAGPPATPNRDIEQAFDESENSSNSLDRQAYSIRWLKQRYGLSRNYAAVISAELGWGRA